MINYTFIASYMYSLRIVLCTFVTVAMCDCHVVIKTLLTYIDTGPTEIVA